MNPAKVNEYDYINFPSGTQKAYSCVEALRVQPETEIGQLMIVLTIEPSATIGF